MAAGDPETNSTLDMLFTKQFERYFVAPGSTRFGFVHCRQLLTLDGTFTLSRYRMTLLIATTIDGNNETLPPCWGLVPNEIIEHWCWFLSRFSEAFPYFTENAETVIISDRDKGIAEAVQQHLPLALHGHCCQHLADNLQAYHGKKSRNLFWPIAYA